VLVPATGDPPTTVRTLAAGEEAAVSELARRAFAATGAEGRERFADYALPEAILRRSLPGAGIPHRVLVAERGGRLVGVLELRDHRHVAMLFVAPAAQRSGVGRTLLAAAVDLIRAARPDAASLSVAAALGSVPAWERWGFRVMGPERAVEGLRSVPMELPLETGRGDRDEAARR
jgi:GNAT superfamily N-acetyltransferase